MPPRHNPPHIASLSVFAGGINPARATTRAATPDPARRPTDDCLPSSLCAPLLYPRTRTGGADADRVSITPAGGCATVPVAQPPSAGGTPRAGSGGITREGGCATSGLHARAGVLHQDHTRGRDVEGITPKGGQQAGFASVLHCNDYSARNDTPSSLPPPTARSPQLNAHPPPPWTTFSINVLSPSFNVTGTSSSARVCPRKTLLS